MDSSAEPPTASEDLSRAFWRSSPVAKTVLPSLASGEIGLEEFGLLAENIPTLCWIANGDGYLVWYNRRWHEYCGTTAEEMEGWGWQSVHHPDLLPEVMSRWQASIASGEPFEMTFPLRGSDGVFRPFLTRVQPLRDQSGSVVRWFGVNTEISQQAEAEERLRAASERVHLALDAGPIAGTWVWDIPNDRFTADERFARSFGLDPALCVRGLPLDQVAASIHPEDWPRIEQLIAEVLGRGGDYRAEYRVRRQEEDYRWVEAVGRCDLDDEGQPLRFPGVLVDIDARKRDEAALRESEARLRALTDSLPAGMVYQMYMSPDGKERRFIYVSKSHEKLTGIPAEAVLEDPMVAYNLILPEYRERFARAEEDAIREGGLFDQEVQYRRADGEIRWCRITSQLRAQADGSLISDGIQIDITEQKLAEQRLRDLNATLEERVAERAAELAQAQAALRQAQKLESMGQLTGGVAHDFNNLLTPIIGGLDLLQMRRVGDERAQRTIAGALASAERAKTLVQRLLAFARRQPLQPEPVDIRGLVVGMAGLLESTIGPRISLELLLAEDLPAARADANQLEMALLNLALNARDAMPEGGTLQIEAMCISGTAGAGATGAQVQLSVTDSGVGMDEATMARAVEPFFSTKGIGKGTGLGLSMAHGLAAQLGGELVIESELGRGTTVRLRLPVSDVDAVLAEAAAERRAHVGAGTALLVDDEELVRASTADMLGDLGYEVIGASSAEAALQRLRDGLRPGLLVTDHLMPGMTGTELAREALALQPELPVLVISGYAEVEGIAGDLPRLTKPFRRAELEASIASLTAD